MKWVLAILMWALGSFYVVYVGQYLELEGYNIIGNIWIVGAVLIAWVPTKEKK